MQIREANRDDAPAIAKVTVDTWRTAYRGIIKDDYLDSLSYAQREKGWREYPFHDSFIFVAEDASNNIIGFAAAGPERESHPLYRGELYAIYIDQYQQNRGIGSTLFQSVAEKFMQAGINSLLLWVLADNPYRRFYERWGGKLIESKLFVMDSTSHVITAYGWPDIKQTFNK